MSSPSVCDGLIGPMPSELLGLTDPVHAHHEAEAAGTANGLDARQRILGRPQQTLAALRAVWLRAQSVSGAGLPARCNRSSVWPSTRTSNKSSIPRLNAGLRDRGGWTRRRQFSVLAPRTQCTNATEQDTRGHCRARLTSLPAHSCGLARAEIDSSPGFADSAASGRLLIPARLEEAADPVVAGLAIHETPIVVLNIERAERLAGVLAPTLEEFIKGLLPASGMDPCRRGQNTIQVEQGRLDLPRCDRVGRRHMEMASAAGGNVLGT